MSRGRFNSETCIEALIALMCGDTDRAVHLFVEGVTDEPTAFGWACGYAGALGATVRGADDARILCELDVLPGATPDPKLEDILGCVAAFISAVNNDDTPGAWLVWRSMRMERQIEFIFTIAKMTALALAERRP